jgi:flavin-dependent dehydrogenase
VFVLAVFGAGPAGSAAAILLAAKGHEVVVIDRSTFPLKGGRLNWLNAKAEPMLDELGVACGPLFRHPFRDIAFHNGDFSKTAKPVFEKPPCYLIDRAELAGALVKAVEDAGITLLQGAAVEDLRLTETSAVVSLAGGETVEGRLLVLAAGKETSLLDRCGLARSRTATPIWTAQVDALVEGGSESTEPRVHVVLGLNRSGSFGVCYVWGSRLSVAINWLGERNEAIPALIDLCKMAAAHGIVPADLCNEAVAERLVRSPAAEALDMDSHVGKHTLLIGDAGGFISAASNEGVYPAMWSAWIAADIADTALGIQHSQDALMSFDSRWRIEMADYLRSPNTDIQFLLPLIFSNQPMADRMGAAFFQGENI